MEKVITVPVKSRKEVLENLERDGMPLEILEGIKRVMDEVLGQCKETDINQH